MRTIGILFYNFIIDLIGIFLMAFAALLSFARLQPVCVKYVNDFLIFAQASLNARIIIFLSGFLLILISHSLAQLILSRFQREKTIAFATPSGEVTIALSAVEDLIRRVGSLLPEIKELRPDVRATKKDTIITDLQLMHADQRIQRLQHQVREARQTNIGATSDSLYERLEEDVKVLLDFLVYLNSKQLQGCLFVCINSIKKN